MLTLLDKGGRLEMRAKRSSERNDKKRKAPMLIRILFCVVIFALAAIAFLLIGNNYVVGIGRHYLLRDMVTNLTVDSETLAHDDVWHVNRTYLFAEEYPFDCIIVLGAKVKSDGQPSSVLYDRCKVGVDAYKAGLSQRMLLSGDHGQQDYNEVQSMLNTCVELGVPKESIFLDHAGFSTYDTLVRAKEVFGAEKVLIVTQEFHQFRALYIAQSLGLEAYGFSSDLREYGPRTRFMSTVREMPARIKSIFSVSMKVKPKYLGDPIDLNGSGIVTQSE